MLAIDKNKDILIANVGGNYYANNNMCTNKGAKLREGELKEKELTCPWHGAKWDRNMILFPQKSKSLRFFKLRRG